MHSSTLFHVAVIGINKVCLDHADSMNSKRIGVIAVGGGNIGFNSMGHSIHTGMSNELLGHGFCEIGVYDSDIGSDLKISDGVLDALLVISDDGESGNFGCSTGS